MSGHLEIRKEIIEACKEMVRLGLVIGTWGNISVRLPDNPEALLITPSGINYFATEPEDLVMVDLEGNVLAGRRKYSSEMQLHRLILKNRPDIGAVVHTHSRYASTLCAARKPLPPLVEDLVQIVGGGVEITPYVPGGSHLELAEAACAALGEERFAVFLAGHGPVGCGRTLVEAMIVCQIVEKASEMYLLSQLVGGPVEIPAEHVREERNRFLYKYGQKEEEGR